MPIYEYTCLDCSTKFDALRRMSEADAPISCEECRSENTSRKISLFYAHSDGRVVTQSAPSCNTCTTSACSTCGIKQ